MLRQRVLTAMVLLPLLCFSVLEGSSNAFTLLLLLITLWGAWEWSALLGCRQQLLRVLFVGAVVLGIAGSFYVDAGWLLWSGLVYWFWVLLAVFCFNRGIPPLGLQWPALRVISGICFLVMGFLSIEVIRQFFGAHWVLLLFVIIMAADTGAYFSGRIFGRHSLATVVSPNKTVEGLLGGVLAALLVSVLGGYFLHLSLHQRIIFACLGVLASLMSVVGDLSVSLMKRQLLVKNTGRLLPGHGGLLDRLDSLFPGMLIFALGFLFL